MNLFRYKRLFLILFLAPAFLLCGQKISNHDVARKAWAKGENKIEPIYVSIFSHNEEDGPDWLDLMADQRRYEDYRADLIAKVKLLRAYGAVLNWETDHVVLDAMKKYENGKLLKATNGKNVLRWMVEDMGMKVDPHGHLSQYNYADLAYLIESLGIKPSSVLGGFALYKCGQTPGKLEQLDWKRSLSINSDGTIRGRKFPNYTWTPRILGQPAMIGHVFDEFSSGVWRPEVNGDFLKHQANGRFIYIGQGYPHDGAVGGPPNRNSRILYRHVDYIRELAGKIRTGQAPGGRIYTASIHIRDSKHDTSIASLKQTLEALKDLVQGGQVIYKDYESVAQIWREKYKEQPNRLDIENFSIYGKLINELNDFRSRPRQPGPFPGRMDMQRMPPPMMGPPRFMPPPPQMPPPDSTSNAPL